jgi:hypothetical protein
MTLDRHAGDVRWAIGAQRNSNHFDHRPNRSENRNQCNDGRQEAEPYECCTADVEFEDGKQRTDRKRQEQPAHSKKAARDGCLPGNTDEKSKRPGAHSGAHEMAHVDPCGTETIEREESNVG